jgi:hypothetical protein
MALDHYQSQSPAKRTPTLQDHPNANDVLVSFLRIRRPTIAAAGPTPTAVCFGCLLAIALALGCNRSGLNLAYVEGVVTFDGAPVADAGVMFMPVDSTLGLPATGVTDSEGRFTLTTANRPGAVIGEHRVAISKSEAIVVPQRRGLPLYTTKDHIPAKYGSVETSGLTASVKDDDNNIPFQLSSK